MDNYRYRTMGSLARSNFRVHENRFIACDPTWVATTLDQSASSVATGEVKSMLDVVVPNYHARSAKGEVFFNYLDVDIYTATHSHGSHRAYRAVQSHDCSGTPQYAETRVVSGEESRYFAQLALSVDSVGRVNCPDLISGSDIAALETQVGTACHASRGSGNAGNMYESLAQFDKNFALFTDLHQNVSKALSDKLGRKTGRGIRRMLTSKANAVASAYLLARYGLKPLVSDISTVLSNMDSVTRMSRQRTRERDSLSASSEAVTNSAPTGNINVSGIVKYTDDVEIKALSIDDVVMSRARDLGLAGENLLTVGWELIPLSFVVDWFANVGDFLQAIAPRPNARAVIQGMTYTRTKTCSWSTTATTSPTGLYTVSSPCSGSFNATHRVVRRLPGLVVPELVVLNDFRFSNLTRCLDASALAITTLKRFQGAMR